MEYASEHERNFGGGLDEHALEQHEPMAAERRPVGGSGSPEDSGEALLADSAAFHRKKLSSLIEELGPRCQKADPLTRSHRDFLAISTSSKMVLLPFIMPWLCTLLGNRAPSYSIFARSGALRIRPITMVNRRSKRREADDAPPRPRRGLQRPADGVPAVARCHPDAYDELLCAKVASLRTLLTSAVLPHQAKLPRTEVFESERTHFRMRAAFAMWQEGRNSTTPTLHYVMYNPDDTNPHEVLSFPMGSRLINELMTPLRDGLSSSKVLHDRISQVSLLTTTTDEALVSITYNKPIDDAAGHCARAPLADAICSSQLPHPHATSDPTRCALRRTLVHTTLAGTAEAKRLAESLGVRLVGRSKGVKIVIGGETVSEQLHVPHGRGECHYIQTEGAFTQPNAKVCEKMLGWAYAVTARLDECARAADLCELYCGNGCFTIALAPNFRRVLATEMSKV